MTVHAYQTDDAEAALLAWRTIDRVHGVHDDEGLDALMRLRTIADRSMDPVITPARKIGARRVEHPDERVTYAGLLAILDRADLRGADLRGADLRGADLRGANLRDADLRDADLWGLVSLIGLPSGAALMVPTPDGWDLRVGCWHRTGPDPVADLRALAESDDPAMWPEARGEQIAVRRPGLLALCDLLADNMRRHPDLIARLAKKWSAR
jgi:hypothetical protein